MRLPVIAVLVVAAGTSCQRAPASEAQVVAPVSSAPEVATPVVAPERQAAAEAPAAPVAAELPPGSCGHLHDGTEALPPCPPGAGDELQRAVAHYDREQYDLALACAAQAAAADPEDVGAQSERAAALVALGLLEEARVAYARALALDPDHADALLGAADLYLNRLPASRDLNELGLAYAARGHRGALRTADRDLAGHFALLQATALNYLGRADEALELADKVLAASNAPSRARFERAMALWELCRFEDSRREWRRLASEPDHRAAAHFHLGLLAERAGDEAGADREFARARKLAPDDYPEPVILPATEFTALVARLVQELPADMRRDLGEIPVATQDLPDSEDLLGDPPLSPEIVGLFRGPSLSEPCPLPQEVPGPCRSIVLYRKNLSRIVASRAELEAQTRLTLIHEIGHLRGEDDVQLAARGLE